jgi:predicted nucleotide-binding protein
MAPRRPVIPKSEPPNLTIEQKRRRIERLQKCVQGLQEFDPQKVQKRNGGPEVLALEAAIDEALSGAFGHRTPAYDRYRRAAKLNHGSYVGIAGLYFNDKAHAEAQERADTRRFFAEGKEQSIALLEQAICALEDEVAELDIETASATHMQAAVAEKALSRKVFVVHGHEGEPREAVSGFLRKIDFTPIILREQTNQGRTIIEKFEAYADVDFAVVVLTPDDVGGPKGGALQPRARQNVLLELGYFIGKLGRQNVCAIKLGDLEIPSDILGIIWTQFDEHGAWKTALAKELRDAGHTIDWNRVMDP